MPRTPAPGRVQSIWCEPSPLSPKSQGYAPGQQILFRPVNWEFNPSVGPLPAWPKPEPLSPSSPPVRSNGPITFRPVNWGAKKPALPSIREKRRLICDRVNKFRNKRLAIEANINTPEGNARSVFTPYICPHPNCPITQTHRTGRFIRADTDQPVYIQHLEIKAKYSVNFDELALLRNFYVAHGQPLFVDTSMQNQPPPLPPRSQPVSNMNLERIDADIAASIEKLIDARIERFFAEGQAAQLSHEERSRELLNLLKGEETKEYSAEEAPIEIPSLYALSH